MSILKASEVEIKKQFGERMREIRLKRGLSQEKLSFEIGMDLTSVNEIEKGRRSPKLVTIYKIASALKVSSSDLLLF